MDLLTELTDRKVLAVVRADTPDLAVACLRTLAGAGVTALEVSLTTPGALDAIARARADSPPDVLIGAGTVLTAEHAELAAAAGASFTVTPGLTPGAPRSTALGLPLLCGALTPPRSSPRSTPAPPRSRSSPPPPTAPATCATCSPRCRTPR